ncbi:MULTISPECIES: hypothetical protein [unclassified Candidatus Cardinium]|uniref:hypothetical protein n=1 Tax=unclassified Candidatus Cardinium TaxID=2641185 RepID=UPI001FB1EC06|nr:MULTISPECIES: hypothetical protein [unclassified Candidatus Cardinium]
MLRLFFVIKYWTLLVVLGLSSGACTNTQNDFLLLDDLVIDHAYNISSYITGKINRPDDRDNDDTDNIDGEETCEKNFDKANASLLNLKNILQEYPKITGHPICKNTLGDLELKLQELNQDIEHLPDGSPKAQLSKNFKHLATYVYSLMNEDLSA